jgi:glycosyltransferase involved in cell wall biosynthesis
MTGIAAGVRLARRHRVKIVHARSYVAALMGEQVKRITGARFLFDMRGLWADERVDGNIWPADGRLYRLAKRAERRLLGRADHVVTLTHASVDEVKRLAGARGGSLPVSVIPTCADLKRFVPRQGPPPEHFTLGHIGSVGTWYLFDELLAFFKLIGAQDAAARLLIVNRGEHEFIEARLAACGIERGRVELTQGRPDEMPGFLHRVSAGSAIIKPVYSKLASAPTKLGEYLGTGIPCLGNEGVGDMERILEGDRVGVALGGFSEVELRDGAARLRALLADPELPARCVGTAHRLFSLEAGAKDYRAIYRALLA